VGYERQRFMSMSSDSVPKYIFDRSNSFEDRLQFLSWLFEGALEHCVPTSTSTDTTSALSSNQDAVTICDNEPLNSIPESIDTQNSERKGKPWL
jgi:hypothetical protein